MCPDTGQASRGQRRDPIGDKGNQREDAWGTRLGGCSEQAEGELRGEQVLRVDGTQGSGEGVRVPQAGAQPSKGV